MILYKSDRSRIESVIGHRWAANASTDTSGPTILLYYLYPKAILPLLY
jgi:hypothetical protein